MSSRQVIAAVIVVGLCLGVVLMRQMQSQADGPTAPQAELLPVSAVQLTMQTGYDQPREFTGTVSARRRSLLGFQIEGRVTEILVDDGQPIYRGQVLARLDTRRWNNQKAQLQAQLLQAQSQLDELQNGFRSEDIAAAKAKTEEIQTELTFEESQLQRRRELLRKGVITETEYEQSLSQFDAMTKRLASAQKDYEKWLAGPRKEQIEAQKAAVSQLNEQLALVDINVEDAELKAPYDGRVVMRMVDEGVVLQAGVQVMEVIESTAMEARIGIPVEKSRLVENHQSFPVRVGENSYQVRLTALLPEVDPATRTRLAIFNFESKDASLVIPEQVVRLTLDDRVEQVGFWIPLSAMLKSGRGLWSCYVLEDISAEDRLKAGLPESFEAYRTSAQRIEVLSIQGQRAYVRGTLRDKDRILAEGAQRVTDGQLVQLTTPPNDT